MLRLYLIALLYHRAALRGVESTLRLLRWLRPPLLSRLLSRLLNLLWATLRLRSRLRLRSALSRLLNRLLPAL